VAGTGAAGMTARVNTRLLLAPDGRAVTGRAVLALMALARALTVAVFLSAASAAVAAEPSPLVMSAVGVLLCALALAGAAAVVLPASAGLAPVVSARDHHRALARRAVPRLRDPDAPGRTRSRAPSVLVPAAP
jgi:hypothetical protein